MSSLAACTCFCFHKSAMTILAPLRSPSTRQHHRKNRMLIIKPRTMVFISTIITTLLVISLSPSKIFSDPYLKSLKSLPVVQAPQAWPHPLSGFFPSFPHKASGQPRWCLCLPQHTLYHDSTTGFLLPKVPTLTYQKSTTFWSFL